MMKRYFTLIFFFTLLCIQAIEISAQCHPYRYNTSPQSGWVSCEASQSPNIDRGESHWLHYDLGVNHTLQSSWIWNHNSITSLIDGVVSYAVDYRVEGNSEWTELGAFSMELSEGSAYYAGEEGPDFGGLTARYVLITILQNGGGECYGFGEWKIETAEPLSDTDDLVKGHLFNVYPNPATDEIRIDVEGELKGYRVEILDQLGKSTLPLTPIYSHHHTFDVSRLETGIYTVCLLSNVVHTCQKISVVRE